MEIADK